MNDFEIKDIIFFGKKIDAKQAENKVLKRIIVEKETDDNKYRFYNDDHDINYYGDGYSDSY
jgi:hypothetical protein